jgi:hypothetical protein
MRAITFRNIFLALFLSLGLTLVSGVLYAFYPLMSASLGSLWGAIFSTGPQTGGIGAVAGGVSESFLKVLLILALVLFLIIFPVLQKRIPKT